MKSKITGAKEGFKPFTLEITVETVQEARILFHVFNRTNLKEVLLNHKEGGYNFDKYSSDIGRLESGTSSIIAKRIKNSGEEL